MLSTRNSLLFILLGIIAGAISQLVVSGASKPVTIKTVVVETPKPVIIKPDPVDSMAFANLSPPPLDAPEEQWLTFAHQVKNTKTGSRHDNSDYTSPLLPWYVYIARHSPEAIYTLYKERAINSRIMGHLIQFGLLPEWYEEMGDARKLLLNESSALINLAVHRGSDFARKEVISLLRENESKPISVRVGPLLFALPAMQAQEVDNMLAQMRDGSMRIDPRSLRALMLEPRLKGRSSEMLAIMRTQARGSYSSPRSRSMSSYFLHGAELGGVDYVEYLIGDAKENNSQPTNFYCAACALALMSDGIAGSALLDALAQEKHIAVQQRSDTGSGHEYLLRISEGGVR